MENQQQIRLSVDFILLATGPQNNGLQLLLIERLYPPFQGSCALPGGFVENHETLKEAALRELKEETGVSLSHCVPIGSYDEVNRDSRGRNISYLFMGLGGSADFSVKAGDDAAKASWYPLAKLPPLAFDHAKMVENTLYYLRVRLRHDELWQTLMQQLGIAPNIAKLLRDELRAAH